MKTSIRLLRPLACVLLAASCGGDEDGGKKSGAATCEGHVDGLIASCPEESEDREFQIMVCEEDLARHTAQGCEASYEAWLLCTSKAAWSCEDGPRGCDAEQSGYFRCQSQSVQSSGCTVLGTDDERCTETEPDAFGCLTAEPPRAGCVPMPDTAGSAASLYCCP